MISPPIGGRGQREIVLAFEVMEEAALGDARRVANVVNRRGGVALGADRIERGVEELLVFNSWCD